MEIISFTGKELETQEKMFSCFDFTITATHGFYTVSEVMTEFKVT